MCRRYDFRADGTFSGWRLARIDLATREATFLTPQVTNQYALHPQPTADGRWLYFTRIDLTPPSSRTRRIMRMALPPTGDAPELVRANASGVLLSPDGTRMAFADWADRRVVHVAALDGSTDIPVTGAAASVYAFSPDGRRLAYLAAAGGCDPIDVVHTDGSDLATPVRVRDCSRSGEFITQVEWIAGPPAGDAGAR